jgi:hypothetical protein
MSELAAKAQSPFIWNFVENVPGIPGKSTLKQCQSALTDRVVPGWHQQSRSQS